MSFVRKAMLYLGLEDGEYDDYGPERQDEPERRPPRERDHGSSRSQGPPSAASGLGEEPSGIGSVRPIWSRAEGAKAQPTGSPSAPLQTGSNPARPRPQVVRPIAVMPNAKPQLVTPETFAEAQVVADGYKLNQPVIMNLQVADRELARRLIDFASGLCYGLGGKMERVDNQVYLLTPTNVEVSSEERRRLHERGYDQ